MQTLKENIINILLESKHVSNQQIAKALETQKQKQIPLRRILVESGIISEEELLILLSKQLYMPTLHLGRYKFDPEVINLIPERMARQYNAVPLSLMGSTLTVAVSDPLNIFALDDLRTLTGFRIDTVLSPEDEINKAIAEQYGAGASGGVEDILSSAALAAAGQERKDVELLRQEDIEISSSVEESEKPPIVKLVDLMLTQALNKRASDIHIEPEKDFLRVRYRIDGALHDVFNIPKSNQNAVIARIKIISRLDITENRLSQDGRFKVRFEGKEVDFRVSGLPTTFGQKFVLRLLDKKNLSIGLDNLGFSEQPLVVFKEACIKPFGMILVTGPTGSGKSTTLYSVLNQLNSPERNIITIEDPVEYQLEGITQVQVKPEISFDFASGLRSILRQSPDVIMIGEIRDSETADIAIKASLTGQLVFSTLHTNDSISSITRLIDMGVEPFLVASSLIMLSAQRLARKLCVKCRKQDLSVSADFLKDIGFTQDMTAYAPVGCKYCNNTGYYGRIAVLEAILVDDGMRELIIRGHSLDEIKKYAIETRGMKTLRDDALLKAKIGLTSIDEALRITTEE